MHVHTALATPMSPLALSCRGWAYWASVMIVWKLLLFLPRNSHAHNEAAVNENVSQMQYEKRVFTFRPLFPVFMHENCVTVWLTKSVNVFIAGKVCDQSQKALCLCPVRPSVRDHIYIYQKFASTISYKSLANVSPNLQLRCSWEQRWTVHILRSKGQRSRSKSGSDCYGNLVNRTRNSDYIIILYPFARVLTRLKCGALWRRRRCACRDGFSSWAAAVAAAMFYQRWFTRCSAVDGG